ncbi:amidohydrolase family protein [Moorella naiadis]|uniref:amidohydrolase family protein n=1 Tax=Moorella naiadis (nom. illeg.) TaxID=3093670 RepID=UPI003D9C924A
MRQLTVDCHVHLTAPEVIAAVERYRGMDHYFNLLTSSPKNKFATAEDTIAEMDRAGIDVAVVFGFAFKDMGLCQETNNYVMAMTKRYTGRFIGLACVNPLAGGLEAELERCRAGGLAGVGELFPEGQGFDLARQEDMGELAGLCSELQWPVLVHLNEPVGHFYPGKTKTTLPQACTFAENNPKLKIILAHWGGGLWVYELMPELKRTLANVYYDTAASPFLYTPVIYQAVKAAGVLDKILLGSDFPLLSPQRYLEDLAASGLPDAEIASVKGLNATRIFGMQTS